MKTITEYVLTIQVQQDEQQRFMCAALAPNGEVLHETGRFSHEADAVYAALHSVAVLNNFSGCLNLDLNNMGLKHD
ncbi:hypothetical protein MIS46_04175 [Wielerella bovis]|uniref:hypothetical protein n=1 Tax=Wielerella bovis TaxID=2917790 RepID=UPI0020190237|nr:hypothetical protein [Wielerella bovis]ULJ63252.1 hypothetical protein MIS46_04175 [Wielerella bovis]